LLLDYMKGHMGGNTIAFLLGEQLPEGREIPVAQAVLPATCLACHEAGLLYPPREGGQLKVKIVEPGNPGYITACGGLTQVLGKALVETSLGRNFGIEPKEPGMEVLLETDAGLLKLEMQVQGGKALRVISDLTLFAKECYRMGVYPLDLRGIRVMRVGKFLVVAGEDLGRRHPELDYAALDGGTRRELEALQNDFQAQTGLSCHDYTFYDRKAGAGADVRAVFPHHIEGGWIEPACGTGSVALGLALSEKGEAPARDGTFRVTLETGGGPRLGGPDLTLLDLIYAGGQLQEARFSHSFIQITSVGQVILS